ncbi:MAG TPA: hypothetical protein VM782_20195 [Stellaceae bacterium]|nr:hypothetical protein [Stellaceae bacterium]
MEAAILRGRPLLGFDECCCVADEPAIAAEFSGIVVERSAADLEMAHPVSGAANQIAKGGAATDDRAVQCRPALDVQKLPELLADKVAWLHAKHIQGLSADAAEPQVRPGLINAAVRNPQNPGEIILGLGELLFGGTQLVRKIACGRHSSRRSPTVQRHHG